MLVTPALAGKWINHLRPDLLPPAVFIIGTIVFFGFVVAHLLRFIVRAPRVDANVLCAGVAGFLLLGLLIGRFASAFARDCREGIPGRCVRFICYIALVALA